MKTRMLAEIFEFCYEDNGLVRKFMKGQHVICPYKWVTDGPAYIVKASGVDAVDWKEFNTRYFAFRKFELSLDFTKKMVKHEINGPKTKTMSDKDRTISIRNFLHDLKAYIEHCKFVQMKSEPDLWPAKQFLPWEINDYMDMPVVVWLHKYWPPVKQNW